MRQLRKLLQCRLVPQRNVSQCCFSDPRLVGAAVSIRSSIVPRLGCSVHDAFATFRFRDYQLALQSREYSTEKKKKVKKKPYKMKTYSALKDRFKLLANGQYKRWKAGKRHNASSKTNKQKRQLRQPTIVAAAEAKVMKKLNFQG